MLKEIKIVKIKGLDGEWSTSDNNVILDCITNEYIHRKHQYVQQVLIDFEIKLLKTSSTFKIDNDNSYNKHRFITGFALENNIDNTAGLKVHTIDKGKFKIYCNFSKASDIIKKMSLEKGINNTDYFYPKDELKYIDMPKPYRKFDNTYYKKSITDIIDRKITSKDLNSSEVQEIIKNITKRNIEMGVTSLTYKEFEGLKYTYGIEIETVAGSFDEEEVKHLNVKAVHDGSLREEGGGSPLGGEYVTGVLVGDAGLSQLHEICRVLQTKSKVDKRCGNHAHIGSLNWTKEDIVYSYILAEMIESELFSTLPKSRRKNTYCRAINKIVTPLAQELFNTSNAQEYDIKINEIYDVIFTEVSGFSSSRKVDRDSNKYNNHPKGSKCGYDKASQRYCWLNYVTLLFNTKDIVNSWTLEFRPMSGTLSYIKIKNWLKICMAFCAFVENHKTLIKNGFKVPITLDTIVSKSYPKTGDKLNNYIKERKQLFMTADESVDYPVDTMISKKSIKEVVCA